MTTDVLVGGALILISVWAFWKDRRIRSGRDRSWVRNYRDSSLPWWVRNGFLVMRFIGATAFCGGLGGIVSSAGLGPLGSVVGLVLMVSGLVTAVIGIVGAYREPDSFKPPWLRLDEQRNPLVREPVGLLGRIGDISAIAIPAVLLLVTIVAGLALLIRDLL